MVKCCVLGCPSNSNKEDTLSPGLRFHRFPKDPEQKKLWRKKLDVTYAESNDSAARVCSKHFPESAFRITADGTKILLTNAVAPTENLPESIMQIIMRECDSADSPEGRALNEAKAEADRLMKVLKQTRLTKTKDRVMYSELAKVKKTLDRQVPIKDVILGMKEKGLLNNEQYKGWMNAVRHFPTYPYLMKRE